MRCGASQPGARGDVKQREFCRCRQVLDVIPDDHSLAGAPGRRRRGKPTDLFVDRLPVSPRYSHDARKQPGCTPASRNVDARAAPAADPVAVDEVAHPRPLVGQSSVRVSPWSCPECHSTCERYRFEGKTTAADCDEPHAATTSCDYVRARAVSRSWLVASSFTRPSGVTTTP